MSRRLVDQFEAEVRIVDELCRPLTAAEWSRPTDCPGWDVHDQVAHLYSLEAVLAGRPPPGSGPAAEAPHVRNELGALNEVLVAELRSVPGRELLDRLASVVAERLDRLRALDEAGWAEETWSPIGPRSAGEVLLIRLYDWWAHEQDIRRAVHRPGHLEGPVAELARDQLVGSLGYVVKKKAAAPEGSSVLFEITGPSARSVAVRVVDGRGVVVDEPPERPSAAITLPFETFMVLGLGRRVPADLPAGEVTLAGDLELAGRVAAALNVTP